MILVILLLTALVLLALLLLVIARALAYIREHPELVTNSTPLAYQRCQETLEQVIARYQQIEGQIAADTSVVWHVSNTQCYTADGTGIEQQRDSSTRRLRWTDIGGVGVRMQPDFKLAGYHRDGSADRQFTTGYSFLLLIVPLSGSTMNIFIPTDGHEDAVNFAAYTIALAERHHKRINVFGFDRPPAPYRQRVPLV
ncbi:MAG: hypothetical protein JXQ72_07320 [Anaerolineae bacterium]|nr:hypothetical protein [Anaerolineae bacterium]